MATPIIPKSEIRMNLNLSVGYGELPAVVKDGKSGWGLPNGAVIFCRDTALEYAEKLDRLIRENLTDSRRLL
jgi:hypothetical protein